MEMALGGGGGGRVHLWAEESRKNETAAVPGPGVGNRNSGGCHGLPDPLADRA